MATTKTPPKSASLKKPSGTASTSVAIKKPSAGNIVSIQDALKAQAAGMSDRINPATGNKIRSTQDKKFILPDGTKTADPLEVVILDFVTVHEFYEASFDKDNIVPPGCFAVGTNPKKMFPSANVPNKQCDDCQACPMNQFGSDGNGKACKNGRLLAVLPPDADDDTPIWLLQVSPTALKGFDAYVATVTRMTGMPPIAMVATVGFNDSVTYAQLEFTNPQPNENLAAMYARQGEATELLNAERDVSGWKGMSKPASKKAPARR